MVAHSSTASPVRESQLSAPGASRPPARRAAQTPSNDASTGGCSTDPGLTPSESPLTALDCPRRRARCVRARSSGRARPHTHHLPAHRRRRRRRCQPMAHRPRQHRPLCWPSLSARLRRVSGCQNHPHRNTPPQIRRKPRQTECAGRPVEANETQSPSSPLTLSEPREACQRAAPESPTKLSRRSQGAGRGLRHKGRSGRRGA